MVELHFTDLESLSQMITALENLDADITKKELELKRIRQERFILASRGIPELLDTLGMKSFVLKNGKTVKIKDNIKVNISEEKREAAYSWLHDNGESALVRTDVTTSFDRSEAEKAIKFEHLLADNKVPYSKRESVHANTLKAFVRDALETGREIPLDLFGVYIYQETEIK